MPQPGTYTAYRQLRPLEGDISQDIQQQEENGFRRRAEKRQEDQIAQQKADKEAQRKQELWDKHVKPLSNYDTGSKSLNEAQGRLILEAQKQYVPLMGILNNPKSTDEEKLNATLKLQNINNLPENLSAMTKTLTERDLAIRKGVQDGTLFANPDYEKNFQEGYQNKLLALDDNGMPMVAFKDLDGDGKNDLETYDQIQNVVPKYDIQQRFDRDKELLEASTKLQPEINGTDDGVTRTVTTAVNPTLLKNYVTSQLYEADGVTPTAKLKSFAREAGVKFDDAKGLKSLSDNFENDIRLRIKGGQIKTRNYNALDAQKEANDQNNKNREYAYKKEKDNKGKPQEQITSENITYTGQVRGNQKLEGTAIEKADGANTYSLSGINLERPIGKKGAFQTVQNIYHKPKTNEIIFDIIETDGTITDKRTGEKTSNIRNVSYSSKKQAQLMGDFVRKYKNSKGEYYKNVEDFAEEVIGIPQKKAKQETKSSKPKTVVQNGYTYTYNEKTGQYE